MQSGITFPACACEEEEDDATLASRDFFTRSHSTRVGVTGTPRGPQREREPPPRPPETPAEQGGFLVGTGASQAAELAGAT